MGRMMAKDLVAVDRRSLTPAQFGDLADVPPELEWLANITNPKTRRAYKNDVNEFSAFTGLRQPAELRTITRAHVIAWRKHLESRELAPSSVRRKLSALSALFDYLCEHNAVAGNPVDGVKRPMSNNNEGSTPALGDAQARKLLDAPPDDTLKGVCAIGRDWPLLYIAAGIYREERNWARQLEATWAERGRRAAGCGAPKCPEQSPDGRGSRRAAASSD